MRYWLEQAVWCIVLAFLALAVLWETRHLIQWAIDLHSGDALQLLREHACTYVEWFFGTDFGWRH